MDRDKVYIAGVTSGPVPHQRTLSVLANQGNAEVAAAAGREDDDVVLVVQA